MSSKHRNKHQVCPNCQYQVGEQNFCPECGQENHDLNLPFGHLVLEGLENTFHFDTKLWTSLITVFTKPGQITKDFVEGKRARHIPPFRMYVLIAVVFFFVVNAFTDKEVKKLENGNFLAITSGLVKFDNKDLRKQIKELPESKRLKIQAQIDTTFVAMGSGKFNVEVLAEIDKVVEETTKSIEDIVETDSTDARFTQLPDSLQQRYVVTMDTLHNRLAKMPAKQAYLKTHGTLGEEKLHIGTGLMEIMNYGNKSMELTFGEAEAVSQMNAAELEAFCKKKGQNYSMWELKRVKYNAKMSIMSQTERMHAYIKYLSYSMFLFMPLFAFLLEIWFRRPVRNYYEHFIFSLHFHSILFLFLIMLWGFINIGIALKVSEFRVGWFLVAILLYLFVALRNFYPPAPRTTDGMLQRIWKNLGFEELALDWQATFKATQQDATIGSDIKRFRVGSLLQHVGLFALDLFRKLIRNLRLKEVWYLTKVFWLLFWYGVLIAVGYVATIWGSTLMV